jgi:hypothetical protein
MLFSFFFFFFFFLLLEIVNCDAVFCNLCCTYICFDSRVRMYMMNV